jgi:copper chaperone CopZ
MLNKVAFDVDGLTCEVCIGDIAERIRWVPGVVALSVGARRGGSSHVEVESESTTRLAWLARAIAGGGFRIAGLNSRTLACS